MLIVTFHSTLLHSCSVTACSITSRVCPFSIEEIVTRKALPLPTLKNYHACPKAKSTSRSSSNATDKWIKIGTVAELDWKGVIQQTRVELQRECAKAATEGRTHFQLPIDSMWPTHDHVFCYHEKVLQALMCGN
jgi:hypothetical protein